MPQPALQPRDIARYRAGNVGIPYALSHDSGEAGPHVMVNALTHGNELCGAAALDDLLTYELRPARGRLTFSFANVAAYERFDEARPYASRYVDEDMNRLWDRAILDSARHSVELERARALRPLVESADYLLDLHSTSLPAPPMLLCGLRPKGRRLARAMGYPRFVIADAGHVAGPRLRDYGAFNDEASPKTAMLVECGQHFEPDSAIVALETALRFLIACGTIDKMPSGLGVTHRPDDQRLIAVSQSVTIESEAFAFADDFGCLQVIPQAGTLIARDGAREVRTPYDDCVLVMPARQPAPGQTAVRLGRYDIWSGD